MIFTKINGEIVQLTRGKPYKPGIPIGTIKISAVRNLEGYLPCEGQALSKTDYPELYEIIGDTFGETSTTFNLPDLRGRIPEGADSNTLGTYSNEQIQSHNHTSNAHSHTISNHCHSMTNHCHYVCPHTHTATMTCGYSGWKTFNTSNRSSTTATLYCLRQVEAASTFGFDQCPNRCTTEGINVNTGNCNFDSASITVCSNTATNSSTGDTETRGKRIGMYYMIKVKEVE